MAFQPPERISLEDAFEQICSGTTARAAEEGYPCAIVVDGTVAEIRNLATGRPLAHIAINAQMGRITVTAGASNPRAFPTMHEAPLTVDDVREAITTALDASKYGR